MIASWSGVSVMGSALPGDIESTETAIVTASQLRRGTTGGYLRFIARTMSAESTPFPTAAMRVSLAGRPGGNIGINPEAPDWKFGGERLRARLRARRGCSDGTAAATRINGGTERACASCAGALCRLISG